jgi:hypothetical protein
MTELSTRRSPAAERMRLYRERRRQGLRCLMVELRETEIDSLVSKGLLNFERRNDPLAVRNALYAYLDRTLDAGLSAKPKKMHQDAAAKSHCRRVRKVASIRAIIERTPH